MANQITFHGAARTVTGSKHLIETNGKKILVDCGIFQGSGELRSRNWAPLDFDPTELDCVVLTHAHQDHIGYLPKLVRDGYRGPIYCTKATKGLCAISLPDSGRIQEEDAYHHNKHGSSKHLPALPLYTERDSYECLKQLETVPYHTFFDLPGKMKMRYLYAGHILGSTFIELYFENGEKLVMGGDLGRWDTPIIKDPEIVDFADYLVVESTYGDRMHPTEDPCIKLEQHLKDAVKNGSCVLVPSFAIGRTQELLYYISRMQEQGSLPRIPIFVDSPMATSTSQLYGQSNEEWDEEMLLMCKKRDYPIEPTGLSYVRDANASKALNSQDGPMVVIAGSGMANGGRILHHMMHRLSKPNTVVLFTGYQAEETLGRRLLEGADTVKIFGKEVEVRCQVDRLNALSAHADQGELLRWLKGFKSPPKQLFIVHGEPKAQDTFAQKVRDELGWTNIHVPEQGDAFTLS